MSETEETVGAKRGTRRRRKASAQEEPREESAVGAKSPAREAGDDAALGGESSPQGDDAGPHGEAGVDAGAIGEAEEEGDDLAGPSKAQPVSVSRAHLKSILESLIFVADEPVGPGRLARAARTKMAELAPLLDELVEEHRGRGVELVEVAGGYQFRSAPANAPFVRSFVQARPVRLSRAQLEVLSIAAYRQPVTRPEMDDIRGVDCGSAIKVLLDRGLIKILGRKEEPGRPLLYGTTPAFLEFFGLAGLKDLPTLKEFSELSEESRALFERKVGEPLADGELERLTREPTVPPPAGDDPFLDELLGDEALDAGEGASADDGEEALDDGEDLGALDEDDEDDDEDEDDEDEDDEESDRDG